VVKKVDVQQKERAHCPLLFADSPAHAVSERDAAEYRLNDAKAMNGLMHCKKKTEEMARRGFVTSAVPE
jgi:hypothetical protein